MADAIFEEAAREIHDPLEPDRSDLDDHAAVLDDYAAVLDDYTAVAGEFGPGGSRRAGT